MTKKKRKRSSPRNIKFSEPQADFVLKKAAAQFDDNFSAVIKNYVNEDMKANGVAK